MQVGGLIVFSGRRGAREKELEVQVRQDHRDRWHFGDIAIMQKMRVCSLEGWSFNFHQVTAILLSLEREFEHCQRGLEDLGGDDQVGRRIQFFLDKGRSQIIKMEIFNGICH